jgi:hypothetical protein
MKKLLPLFFFVILSACSNSADMEVAKQAVRDFHDQLDAGQFQALYNQSSDDLKKMASEKEFIALLDAVHRKLGVTKSFELKERSVMYEVSGATMTLNYETVYAEGNAQESFVYRLKDDKAILYGYHINSNTLITK